MDYKRGSSAVAKTGLGLGIAGTALGLLGGTGLLGGAAAAAAETAAFRGVPYGGYGRGGCGECGGFDWGEGRGCHGFHFEDEAETHYEASLRHEVNIKDFEISTLKSKKYTDARVAVLEKQVCDLRVALAIETERREDET